MVLIRLNKYLAQQGIASRRESDRLIADGLVSVNGKIVTEMGVKIDSEKDRVSFNKKVADRQQKLIYIMLNKPAGYVTSAQKTRFEKDIVMDLVKIKERIYPVGRLDKDTTGLLILTNDGTLTYKITHPSSECPKEYEVTVAGIVTNGIIEKLEKGVKLWGERTKSAIVKKMGPRKMRITITEGKNRQIRRICQKVGLPVIKLKRVCIKGLCLGDLEVGEWRYLTKEEVNLLKQ